MPPLLEINAKAKKQTPPPAVVSNEGWKPIQPGVLLNLNTDYKTKDKRIVRFEGQHAKDGRLYLVGKFHSNNTPGLHEYLWTLYGMYAGRKTLLIYPEGHVDAAANVAMEVDTGLGLEEAWGLYVAGVPLKYRNKAEGSAWYPYPGLFAKDVFSNHHQAYIMVRSNP
jgi:hypothetical protein